MNWLVRARAPLRFALLRFLRGPMGRIARRSCIAVVVAAGILRARGGKCHRTRKQLLRPAGALGALWQPDALHLRLTPFLFPSTVHSRVSDKSDLPQSTAWQGVGWEKKSERKGRGQDREGAKERKKKEPAAAGRRTLSRNGLKGTSVGLIALIFTRFADDEKSALRSTWWLLSCIHN